MEWIIIGALAFVVVCIAIMYFINSKKIKKNSGKVEDKKGKKSKNTKGDEPKSKDGKIEVESKITAESPLETAIKEENKSSAVRDADMVQAFEMINKQAEQYETTQKLQKGKLKFQREKFVSQIQQSIEENGYDSVRNHVKSETATIGKEGPTIKQLDPENIKKDNLSKDELSKEKTIADQISNLSPEMRAILINDILNNKY